MFDIHILHALLLFGEMIVISVSINSNWESFIVLLFKDSLTELKIRVFKSFNEQKTRKLVYKDGVERV